MNEGDDLTPVTGEEASAVSLRAARSQGLGSAPWTWLCPGTQSRPAVSGGTPVAARAGRRWDTRSRAEHDGG